MIKMIKLMFNIFLCFDLNLYDRSHIVMAKLVEKASGENDDILSDFIYW